jgi:hypothetical protein
MMPQNRGRCPLEFHPAGFGRPVLESTVLKWYLVFCVWRFKLSSFGAVDIESLGLGELLYIEMTMMP